MSELQTKGHTFQQEILKCSLFLPKLRRQLIDPKHHGFSLYCLWNVGSSAYNIFYGYGFGVAQAHDQCVVYYSNYVLLDFSRAYCCCEQSWE